MTTSKFGAAHWTTLAITLVLGLVTHQSIAQTAPEPKIISDAWEFEFEFKQPRVILVNNPDGVPEYYWYLPYTVTNRTGEDRLFVPKFKVMTDQGHLIDAGRKIGASVFEAIKKQERNELLESPVQVIGRLLQGEDNARDSVAIWKAPTQDVDQMWIFISGLSGETATVQHPLTGKKIILRKTMMLEFETPGSSAQLATKPVQTTSKKWIMR